jgi:tetratricopeptide (TPR) repeat protein
MQTNERAVQFWDWFQQHEDALYRVNGSDESLLEEVAQQLSTVQQGLVFEIGPVEDGQRLFEVSAGGLVELAAAVVELVNTAPSLPRWRVTAFKQAHPLGAGVVRMHGKEVRTEEILCSVTRELRRLAITLYFPALPEDEAPTWGEIGFTLLDAQLGEYTVMSEVGSVDFAPAHTRPEGTSVFSLDQLPIEFDRAREAYKETLTNERATPLKELFTKKERDWREADEERWAAIEEEGLAGEQIAVRYFFFAWSELAARRLEEALIDAGHSDVSVEPTTTVAGDGFSISGTLVKAISEQQDLFDITRELSQLALRCEAEFDGYSLERSADLSEIDVLVMRTQQLIENHRYGDALNYLEQYLPAYGDEPEVAVLLAYVCVKRGDSTRAADTLEQAEPLINQDGTPTTVLWNAACTHAVLGRARQACAYLERVFKDNPEFLEFAATDPDFEHIRSSQEFRGLLLRHAV